LFFVTLAWLGLTGPSAVAAQPPAAAASDANDVAGASDANDVAIAPDANDVAIAPDANDVAAASDANDVAAASDANEPASVPADGQSEIIKSIEFEGNRKFKDHVLRERLGFALGDGLDPFLAEGGRLTIAEVYRKIGYAFVEVALDRDRLGDGHLFYRIEEGPRVQIASIDFVGNEAIGGPTITPRTPSTKTWIACASSTTIRGTWTTASRPRPSWPTIKRGSA